MDLIAKGWYSTPKWIRVTVIVLSSVVLWEAAVRILDIKPFLLPAPSRLVTVMIENAGYLLQHTVYTLYETLLGFVIAVILGVLLAMAIVSSRFLEETVYVLLVTLNSIPKVAVAPLFVVWMGTGMPPKVAIAAMISVFVIVIDMVLGLKSIDPDMIDLAGSMKATKSQILLHFRFPTALPNLFAGMKVGITFALIGAIVGEFVASDRGLGYVIMVAQGQFDVPTMFAAVTILAVIGTLLFFVIDVLEHIALPWHVSRRRDNH
jgi:NitT/TauT family transport system permease protein